MTGGRGDVATIPARVTARGLAEAIGRDVSEVTTALKSRGEPDSPEDYISAELAKAISRSLGAHVEVEARDLALEALYEHETRGELVTGLSGRARRLAGGVVENREELDRLIEEASEHWSVARMPLVDRNVLRLGLYELEHEADTPSAVIISEAVRLAQTYSTERSGSFVNGVLATLASTVRGRAAGSSP